MDLPTLLSGLHERGYSLLARNGKVVCRGMGEPPADLLQGIRNYRDALLKLPLEEDGGQLGRAGSPDSSLATTPYAAEAAHQASTWWVAIDGVLYSPAAADLYRRSVPFSADAASDRCMTCDGTRWWRLRAACPWVCARCDPTDRAEHEVEWREGGPPVLGTDPPATPPSATLARTLTPGVAHE